MKTGKKNKYKIKKDDKVVVVSGKETGKTGKVLHVYTSKNRILISGVNLQKRHVRPSRDLPQGGIIEKETPFNITNVMMFCNKCSKGVKVGMKRFPDGSVTRYCKKCEVEL